MRATLIYLALGNLVIGSAGFMLGGLLEPLAAGLKVSVAAAGQLMTVYALANAVGSPLLIAASSQLAAWWPAVIYWRRWSVRLARC